MTKGSGFLSQDTEDVGFLSNNVYQDTPQHEAPTELSQHHVTASL
jgi:hypothetical protein